MAQNSWYHKTWAKVVFITAAIGIASTLVGYIGNVYDWFDTQESLPVEIANVDKKTDEIIKGDSLFNIELQELHKRLLILENWKNSKSLSFAVGFRMKKIIDDYTGRERWVKQYRDESGHWNDVFEDPQMSQEWYEITGRRGVKFYYYIDRETHQRVYV